MECSQPAVFIDGDKLCVLMTLVKVTGTYIGGCACTVQCIYHLGRMHKHTQTVISLLYFLITVTIGGPPVRIYLSPLLPPIHFAPLPHPRTHSFQGVGLQWAQAPLSLGCKDRIREILAAKRAYGLHRTANKPYTFCVCSREKGEDYQRVMRWREKGKAQTVEVKVYV